MTKTRGQILNISSVEEMLKAEANHGIDNITLQDQALAKILKKSLEGKRLITLVPTKKPKDLSIDFATDNKTIKRYDLANQQSLGSWFHPEKASLKVGFINLPFYHNNLEKFAMNAVLEERALLKLESSTSILVWGALEPLFLTLFEPLNLLSVSPLKLSKIKRESAFEKLKSDLVAIGIEEQQANKLQLSSSWLAMSANEQLDIKMNYLQYLASLDQFELITKYRLLATQTLLKRFYQKRKSQMATRENVLTKKNERILVGFYGGDWLEFLNYIEEEPEVGDRIQTELPSTTIVPGINPDAVQIAKEMGLDPSQVTEVAASLFPQAVGMNPIEERIKVLRDFWDFFKQKHSKQKPGMVSLWGLVHQYNSLSFITFEKGDFSRPTHPLIEPQTLLSKELQQSIESLWNTKVSASYPDKLLTSLVPYYWMGKALGPALEFWEGVYLTAWYFTEGPYSRTDLKNMESYYQKLTDVLNSLETPIDKQLFKELRNAESKLGKPKFIYAKPNSDKKVTRSEGITIEFSSGMGWERRDGFVILRNIISKYLNSWSKRYFDIYLEKQWREPLEEVSNKSSMRLASKGKPFTVKQYARMTENIANCWFGGDVTAVSLAILQPSPVKQERIQVIDSDVHAHRDFIFSEWQAIAKKKNLKTNFGDYNDKRPVFDIKSITQLSFEFLQLYEALGIAPTEEAFKKTLKSYDKDAIHRQFDSFLKTPEQSWELFTKISNLPVQRRKNISSRNKVTTKSPQTQSKESKRDGVKISNEGKEKKQNWFQRIFGRRK